MLKPDNVADYIDSFPKAKQKHLQAIRKVIKKSAPQAEEVISYSMPAFKLEGMLVWFAGHDKHLGFYPMASGIENFKKEIAAYKFSKGAVQFPYDQPLPLKLIEKMVAFRVKENLLKAELKRAKKKVTKPPAK